ncbi:NAD-dependent epimerase/dehydratase family protein [Candidatus Woesebacteria bacterium]|nr:NAD-dependent epimerase/dehydratase family protein [Candidatus Woesebacteria bacterium]QQG47014.1 MAG: NAD-dependent epimerase/dehydratase family protein [Candidatus Woesebacteria bacterium]
MIEKVSEFTPPKEWLPTRASYLIIGSTGLIGSSIAGSISGKDEAYGLSRGNLDHKNEPIPSFRADAGDKDALKEILSKVHPNIIIDLAGNTNLEECQGNPQKAYDQNVGRVISLVSTVFQLDYNPKPVILLGSTDYVYGSWGPFTEESPRKKIQNIHDKVCDYAQTKAMAERELVTLATRHKIPYVILRFAFPYNQKYRQKPGTPIFMFEALSQGKKITALTDLKMTITPTQYIPPAINTLVRRRAWEDPYPIFNIAGPSIYNGFQIAQICKAELERRGVSVKDDQTRADLVDHFFEGKAPRPINGGVLTSKIQKLGIVIPDLKDDIKTFTLPS